MKKQLLILSALTSVMTITLAVVVTRVNNNNGFAFGQGDSHNHTIYLYGEDVVTDEYDDGYWVQPFSISKDDAIVVSQTEKYPINSYDFVPEGYCGTYYSGNEEDITWNVPNKDTSKPNYIAELTGNNNCVVFMFELLNRASIDLKHSFVYTKVYEEEEKYEEVLFNFASYDDIPENDSTLYCASADGYSYYGNTIYIEYVQLTFSC